MVVFSVVYSKNGKSSRPPTFLQTAVNARCDRQAVVRIQKRVGNVVKWSFSVSSPNLVCGYVSICPQL